MVDLGAVADAASTAGGTGTLSAKLRLMTTQLGSLTLAQGSTTSGQTGNLAMGAVTTASPSYTTAQSSPLSLDTTGALRVNVTAGGAGGGAVTVADGADVTQGANADAAATAGSTGTVSAKLRLVTSQLGTIATNTGSAIPAGSAIIGKVSIDQTTPGTTNAVQTIAGTTGGSSTTGNIAANNTTAVVVKASAGTLYGVQMYGIGSAPAYLKIYNATSATCGSGTPVKRLMIPAASTAANGAGSNISFGDIGIAFGTGITYCVTTGITDADTTAPAASTFLVNLDWK
jgi:hypothetical protein